MNDPVTWKQARGIRDALFCLIIIGVILWVIGVFIYQEGFLAGEEYMLSKRAQHQ